MLDPPLWDTASAQSYLTPYLQAEIIAAWPLSNLCFQVRSTTARLIDAAVALSHTNQISLCANLLACCPHVSSTHSQVDNAVPLWSVNSVTEELQHYSVSQILAACDGLLSVRGLHVRSHIMESIAALSVDEQRRL